MEKLEACLEVEILEISLHKEKVREGNDGIFGS
jgi:hypothetical protein